MQLKEQVILIISPEPWGKSFVSKHHYAVSLAKQGNQVYFLNPPGPAWGINTSDFENLWVVDYSGFPPGYRYLPKVVRKAITRKTLRRLESLISTKIQILWSFDSSVFFDLDSAPQTLGICHLVDYNQDFEWRRMAKSALLCLGTTQFIVDRCKTVNQNAHFLHHGYAPSSVPTQEISIADRGINLGYVGNLDIQYFNWPLVSKLIQTFEMVQFYFVGPKKSPFLPEVEHAPNFHWLGEQPSASIPSFLAQMDLLLLCYQANDHYEQLANPHKVMEYLGSGRPIIATPTHEFKNQPELVIMSETGEETDFVNLFRSTLGRLDQHLQPDACLRRQAFAMAHTYPQQIQKVELLLNQPL